MVIRLWRQRDVTHLASASERSAPPADRLIRSCNVDLDRARRQADRETEDDQYSCNILCRLSSLIFSDAVMLSACVVLDAGGGHVRFRDRALPVRFRAAPVELDQLLERRDSIYDNLRDLKFENRAGKYAEQDYEQMRDLARE